ncbi:LOW QUALITY PROTEIN: inosine-uridine preferring nucleoside hydrolase-like [Rhipicephalus sanguineus]|uniref:LOW QUALITY PROTEIN: inosine-uridine preferring nucleoside hydrolase-like n=1 Tax=Rhipicephalus sanguineus TaxID=34632 RepID=UPI001893F45B|nr:LOW QUALITY PROTEIN: inosine-uridine preferring nucleoside hydrolase-like [Rhipicephalus sanguineus]
MALEAAKRNLCCYDVEPLRCCEGEDPISDAVEEKGDMSERTLIIDTDVGVDDALAILLALANPAKCKVLAITCVAGNVELSRVYTNVLRILNHCKKLQIPVYQGCNRPLVQKTMHCTVFHGQDGLGGASEKWPLPTDDMEPPKEHASVAMVDMVQKHPGALTLVAIGPLTNVALAQRLDPTFLSNLKELVIMGGTFEGRGNETATGEFNFTCDPEAASVVLSEAECNTRIVTYEPCKDHILDWDWFENWVGGPSLTAQLVRAITEHPAQRQREVLQREGFMSCDLIAMASVLEPSLVTRCERHPAWVELHGTTTRGMLVVDRRPSIKWHHGKPPHVEFLLRFNIDGLKKLYAQMLN